MLPRKITGYVGGSVDQKTFAKSLVEKLKLNF